MTTEDPLLAAVKDKRRTVVFFMLLGTLLILGAYWTEYERDEFKKTARSATGTVYSVEKRAYYDDDDSPHISQTKFRYYPWVQFFDSNNREFRFRGKEGPLFPDHRVDDRVPVLYDPKNPLDARINVRRELNYTTSAVYFLAALMLCCALVEFIRKPRVGKRRPYFRFRPR